MLRYFKSTKSKEETINISACPSLYVQSYWTVEENKHEVKSLSNRIFYRVSLQKKSILGKNGSILAQNVAIFWEGNGPKVVFVIF